MSQTTLFSPPLFLWFDAPPRAGAGGFSCVGKYWPGKVFFIIMQPLRQERVKVGWKIHALHGTVITLSEHSDPDRVIDELLKDYPDAIHLVNGFCSQTSRYLYRNLLKLAAPRLVLWSEIPYFYADHPMWAFVKRQGLNLRYTLWHICYGRKVGAYLPLGKTGVEVFRRLGWPARKLFPFMYCPEYTETYAWKNRCPNGNRVRFLYVGRLSRQKGLDMLMNAFGSLTRKDWTLAIVGKNGNYEAQIQQFAQQHPQVEYLGCWQSDQVIRNIADYDVMLIPTRFDGWNLLPHEAMAAGVGSIVSDAAISHELTSASGTGIVFEAGNQRQFEEAICRILDHPELLDQWRQQCVKFLPRISPENISRYLVHIIRFIWDREHSDFPRCPWE